MEEKKCKVCGLSKPMSDFYFRKDNNKYRNECIECHKNISKKYRINNKEKIKEKIKLYREKNREQILQKKAQYREKNREVLREKARKYYKDNMEIIKTRRKQQRKKSNETTRIYVANRKKNDKIYAFKSRIRPWLIKSFTRKKYIKNSHLEEIVGKPIDELVQYLLQTFKNNYGYEWDGTEKVHIDHIIPLKNAKTEKEVMNLCYYTNLQLLKAEDNLRKRAEVNWKIRK